MELGVNKKLAIVLTFLCCAVLALNYYYGNIPYIDVIHAFINNGVQVSSTAQAITIDDVTHAVSNKTHSGVQLPSSAQAITIDVTHAVSNKTHSGVQFPTTAQAITIDDVTHAVSNKTHSGDQFPFTAQAITTDDVTHAMSKETYLDMGNGTKSHIGILIPATTRGLNITLSSLILVSKCIPSILLTIEPNYIYTIYLGIDAGDDLEKHLNELKSLSPLVNPVIVEGGTFVKAVNEIARHAYNDGVNYMVRINDDSVFETRNWTSLGINSLLRYDPPNIGVVGPTCNQGKTNILTHDMVHRTHLDIFNHDYYPPQLENWWADDWITHVYEPNRSSKRPKWVVRHTQAHGQRYHVNHLLHQRLSVLESHGKKTIERFITNKHR